MCENTESWLSEIPFRILTIGEEIGKGRFKRVRKGFMGRRNVVIMSYAHQNGISGELAILERLAKHPENPFVPHVYGTCQNRDAFLLIAELAIWGALKTVLTEATARVSVMHKLHIAEQIAGAMEFLEMEKVVHADVSCRNVLVFQLDKDPSLIVVRVTDFGLSVILPIGVDSVCRKQPRAVRWCAPETVLESNVSHAADAWSLGATFWELFSNGVPPWCNMEKRAEVSERLCALAQGTNHADFNLSAEFPRPAGCPVKMHEMMFTVLRPVARERARFQAIQAMVVNLIESGEINEQHDVTISKFETQMEESSTTAASGATTPTNSDCSILIENEERTQFIPCASEDSHFKTIMGVLGSPDAQQALGSDVVSSIWLEVQAARARASELADLKTRVGLQNHLASTGQCSVATREHVVSLVPPVLPAPAHGMWRLYSITGQTMRRQEFENESIARKAFDMCDNSCPHVLRDPLGREVLAYHWTASCALPNAVPWPVASSVAHAAHPPVAIVK